MAKELAYINRQDLINTADALRERLSTADTYATSEFADAIREIQGGIDTSDANATENDIINGKSAYVNGKNVNGMLARANGSYERGVASNTYIQDVTLSMGNNTINLSAHETHRGYIDETQPFYMGFSPSEFGDAQPESVLQGETFTSSAGLKEEGTLVVNKYYTGSSEPSSSLGNNGDLYLLVPSASSDPDDGEDSPIWEEEPIDEEENPFN